MPTLFLKCRSCGKEFPTPIGVTDPKLQGSLIISGLKHRCPHCNAEDRYSTLDYFIHKTEAGAAADGSAATIGGDQEQNEKTQTGTQTGRLAGYAVEGAPPSKTEAAPPAGSNPPGNPGA
jgi:DNA-directed RNA polymerase subunit RPC12/RpoP